MEAARIGMDGLDRDWPILRRLSAKIAQQQNRERDQEGVAHRIPCLARN
jgi:hypothetical protein